jgi:hypothetical protein
MFNENHFSGFTTFILKKIKKSPRCIAGGLERIFVVIEITKCVAFIFDCDWLDVKTFRVVPRRA